AAAQLHHAQLTRVERLELVGGDVDALDLATVLEVANVFGRLVVERLALEHRREFRLGLAALAGFFLLPALGLDALVLLALGADRVGLGQVDVLTRLLPAFLLRRGTLPRLARLRARGRTRATLAGAGLSLVTLRRPGGLRCRLEAEPEELVAECVARGSSVRGPGKERWLVPCRHEARGNTRGGILNNAGVAARRPDRRRNRFAIASPLPAHVAASLHSRWPRCAPQPARRSIRPAPAPGTRDAFPVRRCAVRV